MKTKIFFLILMLLAVGISGLAQEPFDVPCVDYPTFKKIDYTQNFIETQTQEDHTLAGNIKSFSQQNIGFSSTEGSLIPNINVNIIQYRLGLFSRVATKDVKYKKSNDYKYREGDIIRVYLPLLLISKFNTHYDSAQLATLTDMTSFIGSPFTLRFMPSYTMRVGLENTFTIGHTSDLRTILFNDSISKNLQAGFGYYGTLGAKYAGRGEVRDETGTTYEGNWSITALLYTFVSNGKLGNQLFDNQKNTTSGIETIFKFKVAETKVTRFNLYASAQYQFNKSDGKDPFIFKIGIGN